MVYTSLGAQPYETILKSIYNGSRKKDHIYICCYYYKLMYHPSNSVLGSHIYSKKDIFYYINVR